MSGLIPDRFVLILLGAVLLGWLLPVSGVGLAVAQNVSFAGIFALFFLHGLKLPRDELYRAAKGWQVWAPHAATCAGPDAIWPEPLDKRRL